MRRLTRLPGAGMGLAAATGRIAVFVDERKEPIMVATDRTRAWGRAGVGSFDDTAALRHVAVTGTHVGRRP